MKKLNKKGFTLVELLAVIVVLAIIMVIAVPSVITAMNTAKQSAFLVYAQKMINTAQQKYQTELLTSNSTGDKCYSISTLTEGGSSQYSGYVKVTYDEREKKNIYTIQMKDGSYSIGVTASDSKITGDNGDGVKLSDIETIKSDLGNHSLNVAPSADIENPCDKKNEV